MKRGFFVTVCCCLLILLFAYTGMSKIVNHNLFTVQIEKSVLLQPIAPVIALGVPGIELVIAFILVLPRTRLVGLYASFYLLCFFTIYILYALTFYDKMPCKCGGVLQSLSWQAHTWFNVFFIAVSMTGIVGLKGKTRYE